MIALKSAKDTNAALASRMLESSENTKMPNEATETLDFKRRGIYLAKEVIRIEFKAPNA